MLEEEYASYELDRQTFLARIEQEKQTPEHEEIATIILLELEHPKALYQKDARYLDSQHIDSMLAKLLNNCHDESSPEHRFIEELSIEIEYGHYDIEDIE